ncbi:MAG: YbaN family protein [Gammaproteobacteria bacterium]|nr:YbaN family protein [Gammaproteobacteria bacterium]
MVDESKPSSRQHPMPGRRAQMAYLLLAYTATLFAVAGVFLPLLPATPFLLVAVWAASRGSQRVHDWIYDQPLFARLINDWQQQGAVPLSAKWLATAMMLGSWLTLIWSGSHWMLVLGMSLFFVCIGGFLWTRPNPRT